MAYGNNYGDGGFWFTQPVNNGYGEIGLDYDFSGHFGETSIAGKYTSGSRSYAYWDGTDCKDAVFLAKKLKKLKAARTKLKGKKKAAEKRLTAERMKIFSSSKAILKHKKAVRVYRKAIFALAKAIRAQNEHVKAAKALCAVKTKKKKSRSRVRVEEIQGVSPEFVTEATGMPAPDCPDGMMYIDGDCRPFETGPHYTERQFGPFEDSDLDMDLDMDEDDAGSAIEAAADDEIAEMDSVVPAGIAEWYEENKTLVMLGAAGVGGFLLIRMLRK